MGLVGGCRGVKVFVTHPILFFFGMGPTCGPSINVPPFPRAQVWSGTKEEWVE